MRTTFICLANSKKENGRCIAGIELKNGEPLLSDGKLKWLRPVCKTTHGEVPLDLVSHIKLLDIVEIEILNKVPDGFQSENLLFDAKSITVIGTFSINRINQLYNNSVKFIFGNKGTAVPESEIDFIFNSLMIVQVNKYEIVEKSSAYYTNKQQIRIKFSYNQNQYDFPITDLAFCNQYKLNNNIFIKTPIYLTLSLAVNHNGWHSKLVAGIIY